MKQIMYDGKSLSEFGVYSSGKGTFSAPAKDVSYIQVPGRNGDLIIDNGRYNNITVPYNSFIVQHLRERFAALRAFLFSRKGYKRLEDSFNPEEFRLAAISESINPELTKLNREGTFTMNFNCKPQRFLKIGEQEKEFTDDGTIYNPTLFDAKPLLRVYGTGSVSLNGSAVRIIAANEYTDIDCDTMNAYKGTENRNRYVEFVNDAITLGEGENTILLNDNVTRLVITPRWWTI